MNALNPWHRRGGNALIEGIHFFCKVGTDLLNQGRKRQEVELLSCSFCYSLNQPMMCEGNRFMKRRCTLQQRKLAFSQSVFFFFGLWFRSSIPSLFSFLTFYKKKGMTGWGFLLRSAHPSITIMGEKILGYNLESVSLCCHRVRLFHSHPFSLSIFPSFHLSISIFQ